MTSKNFNTIILYLFFLSGLGCTETLPLDPVITNESDWAPSLSLANNDYQRIELFIDRPPRKELLRNIAEYYVEITPQSLPAVAFVDTIPALVIRPAYIYTRVPHLYDSKPLLQYNQNYSVRISVRYISGPVLHSNSLHFITPPESGRVVQSIALPPGVGPRFGNSLAFNRNHIILLSNTSLYRIDPQSGQTTRLKDDFFHTREYTTPFEQIAVCGDTLVTYYQNYGSPLCTFVRVNLNSLAVDSTLRLDTRGSSLIAITGHGSSLLTLWSLPNGRLQVRLLDLRTGNTLQTFPEAERIPGPFYFTSDGTNLWSAPSRRFSSRIQKIDPFTLSVREDYKHPLFSPHSIAWDGTNFWSFDQETYSLAKLELAKP